MQSDSFEGLDFSSVWNEGAVDGESSNKRQKTSAADEKKAAERERNRQHARNTVSGLQTHKDIFARSLRG